MSFSFLINKFGSTNFSFLMLWWLSNALQQLFLFVCPFRCKKKFVSGGAKNIGCHPKAKHSIIYSLVNWRLCNRFSNCYVKETRRHNVILDIIYFRGFKFSWLLVSLWIYISCSSVGKLVCDHPVSIYTWI